MVLPAQADAAHVASLLHTKLKEGAQQAAPAEQQRPSKRRRLSAVSKQPAGRKAVAEETADAFGSLLLDREYDAQVTQVRLTVWDVLKPAREQLKHCSGAACAQHSPFCCWSRPELVAEGHSYCVQLLKDADDANPAQLARLLRARIPPPEALLCKAAAVSARAHEDDRCGRFLTCSVAHYVQTAVGRQQPVGRQSACILLPRRNSCMPGWLAALANIPSMSIALQRIF